MLHTGKVAEVSNVAKRVTGGSNSPRRESADEYLPPLLSTRDYRMAGMFFRQRSHQNTLQNLDLKDARLCRSARISAETCGNPMATT